MNATFYPKEYYRKRQKEWHDLNEGFGLSCFMLAQFKEKYSL